MLFWNQKILHIDAMLLAVVTEPLRKSPVQSRQVKDIHFRGVKCERNEQRSVIAKTVFPNFGTCPANVVVQLLVIHGIFRALFGQFHAFCPHAGHLNQTELRSAIAF